MTITLKVDNITPSLTKKASALKAIPKNAFTFFRKATPIKTGNARSNTYLDKETIVGGYSYASKLDHGSSRQAPNGMSKPTKAYIKKEVDAILKRK